MRARIISTSITDSRSKRFIPLAAALAAAAAVVLLLGLHDGVLRIVFVVVAVPVWIVVSLAINSRQMTPQELHAFEEQQHEIPMHDVKVGRIELKFGADVRHGRASSDRADEES